ncbi:MAG TPA: BRCT domain-containing protein [Sphingopyxis sp.]|nr:BRCT domain-containing protein [Sphingopyxis sp.]
MNDEEFYNRVGGERIESRQIDELIGLCRGMAADGSINQLEAEFLQKWLAANIAISRQPVIQTLYHRVSEVLADGRLEDDEAKDLLSTLDQLSSRDFEHGEVLKSSDLPLCNPAPHLVFEDRLYCFTGTFNFGRRAACEKAVLEKGAQSGSLTKKTDVLVVGVYATESWKHSSFGNKIIKACEMRDEGVPIAIVSEAHWQQYL